jgi:hypothetical protein
MTEEEVRRFRQNCTNELKRIQREWDSEFGWQVSYLQCIGVFGFLICVGVFIYYPNGYSILGGMLSLLVLSYGMFLDSCNPRVEDD